MVREIFIPRPPTSWIEVMICLKSTQEHKSRLNGSMNPQAQRLHHHYNIIKAWALFVRSLGLVLPLQALLAMGAAPGGDYQEPITWLGEAWPVRKAEA